MTKFYEKVRVVSSDFSMMKIIVAPCAAKSLPVRLICYGSFNLVCLLKSIAFSL